MPGRLSKSAHTLHRLTLSPGTSDTTQNINEYSLISGSRYFSWFYHAAKAIYLGTIAPGLCFPFASHFGTCIIADVSSFAWLMLLLAFVALSCMNLLP